MVLNFGLETNTYLFVFKGPGQPLFFYCFILFSTVFILTDFKAEAFRVFSMYWNYSDAYGDKS